MGDLKIDLAQQVRAGELFALGQASGGTGRVDGRSEGVVERTTGATTITYGQVLAKSDTNGAGTTYKVTPSTAVTDIIVGVSLSSNGAGIPGYMLVRGIHPQVNIVGSVTAGDLLYASSTTGAATSTRSPGATVLGRVLQAATSNYCVADIDAQGASLGGTSHRQLLDVPGILRHTNVVETAPALSCSPNVKTATEMEAIRDGSLATNVDTGFDFANPSYIQVDVGRVIRLGGMTVAITANAGATNDVLTVLASNSATFSTSVTLFQLSTYAWRGNGNPAYDQFFWPVPVTEYRYFRVQGKINFQWEAYEIQLLEATGSYVSAYGSGSAVASNALLDVTLRRLDEQVGSVTASSSNILTGQVDLRAGTNMTLAVTSNTITFNAAAGGGGGGTAHSILSATHTDTLPATVQRGDMMAASSNAVWKEFVTPGADAFTSDRFLGTLNGDPHWRPRFKGVDAVTASTSNTYTGQVDFRPGNNITFSTSSNQITINGQAGGGGGASVSYGSNATDVSSVSAGGVSTLVSSADHVHRGVHQMTSNTSNALFGNIDLQAGLNIALAVAGQIVTISAPNQVVGGGGGGGGSTDAILGQTGVGGATITGLQGSPDITVSGTNDKEFDSTTLGGTAMGALTNEDANTTRKSHYYQRMAATAAFGLVGRYWASPATPFTVTAKMAGSTAGGQFHRTGLFVGESTPGKTAGIYYELNTGTIRAVSTLTATTPTSGAAYRDMGTGGVEIYIQTPLWFRIVVASTTDITFYWSTDGMAFKIHGAASFNPGFTIGSAGVCVDPENGTKAQETFWDWIRYT